MITAIVIGLAPGHFYPDLGEQMKPLGDTFIKLIKMIIASIKGGRRRLDYCLTP